MQRTGKIYKRKNTGCYIKVIAVHRGVLFVCPKGKGALPFIILEEDFDYEEVNQHEIPNLIDFLFQFRG